MKRRGAFPRPMKMRTEPRSLPGCSRSAPSGPSHRSGRPATVGRFSHKAAFAFGAASRRSRGTGPAWTAAGGGTVALRRSGSGPRRAPSAPGPIPQLRASRAAICARAASPPPSRHGARRARAFRARRCVRRDVRGAPCVTASGVSHGALRGAGSCPQLSSAPSGAVGPGPVAPPRFLRAPLRAPPPPLRGERTCDSGSPRRPPPPASEEPPPRPGPAPPPARPGRGRPASPRQ